uniref:MRG-binding protein n=1 Tax=Biomphalaria glabrata TaxID=6526 RepID=A0A2C9LXW5_BIOGL
MTLTVEANEVVWNVDMEVNLFHAMRGHKPAGVNRHFQMLAIHERLSSSCKKITSDDVWGHLSTLYDLQALNESEMLPFPNKLGDFDIVDSEFQELSEKSFPRTSYINLPTVAETPKAAEVSSKSTPKIVKTETKPETKTPSHKSESRGSTPSVRVESKSSPAPFKSLPQSVTPSTPSQEPSPKRTKRTRNVPSANSPATPTEPLAKRRR